MFDNREKDLWEILDRYHLVMALLGILILGGLYFWLGWMKLNDIARKFLQDIIANLIPVLLLFIGSYALFRRIQALRSKREAGELASKVSSRVADIIKSELTVLGEDALALREAGIKGFYPVDLVQEQLVILCAIYGAKGKYYNVIQRLNSRISGGRLKGIASNDYLLDGADPIKGVGKKLIVVYYHAGQVYSTTKDENEGLSFPER